MLEAPSRILLTGFGPFPGVPENASALVVEELTRVAKKIAGAEVSSVILPVDWIAAPRQIVALIASERPALVLHFGVSRRAQGLVVETVARNRRGSVLDAFGKLPASEKIEEQGADMLASTLPAISIVERLRVKGLPAEISQDAGDYLCNAVLYASLQVCRERDARVGFIHLPVDLSGSNNGLSVPAAVKGGLEIIRACLEAAVVS